MHKTSVQPRPASRQAGKGESGTLVPLKTGLVLP